MPNPDRPVYMELLPDGELRDLVSAKSAVFHAGDLLWFSFKAQFWFGKGHWGLELTPVQFIRVGRLRRRDTAAEGGIVSDGEEIVSF